MRVQALPRRLALIWKWSATLSGTSEAIISSSLSVEIHTPISYWNTTSHHGSWLQTTATRPVSIEFGGSFMPIHFLGALGEGAAPAGGLNLHYFAGIGNGRSSVLSRDGDWGAVNNAKALVAGGFVKPDWAYGLEVGASVYKDKIDAIGKPESHRVNPICPSGLDTGKPQIRCEFFNINHTAPGTGITTSSQTWYVQVGWRLSFADLWALLPIRAPAHSSVRPCLPRHGEQLLRLGARSALDISSFAAFKLEYRNQSEYGVKNFNSMWAQTDFTF